MSESNDGRMVFQLSAHLAPLDSAVKRSGKGDGARITLDVPECDVNEALLVARACPLKNLRLTIEIEPNETIGAKGREVKGAAGPNGEQDPFWA